MQKIFIQWGDFSILSIYFCQLFVLENKSPHKVRKTSQAVDLGSNLCRAKIFLWFDWDYSEIPMVPMVQWVKQQRSEALGPGSDRSIYLYFSTLLKKIWTPIIFFHSYQN